MHNSRSLVYALLFFCAGSVAQASTGRITDAQTSHPIAGATVYVVWYYKPIDFGLSWHSVPSRACDAAAITTTDVNGEYDVGVLNNLRSLIHETRIAVVAPGYYDPWMLGDNRNDPLANELLKTFPREEGLPPPGMSRMLRQLGDVAPDVKLLALLNASRVETCVSGAVEPFVLQQQFVEATHEAMGEAICRKTSQTPSVAVVRRIFSIELVQRPLWRIFVNPLLPPVGDAPIPQIAVENLCSIEGLLPGDTSVTRVKPNEHLKLRLTLRRGDSDEPVGALPVRVLWGTKTNPGTRFDRDHPLYSPMRSIVLQSNEDGTMDLPVSLEMLQEQNFQPNRIDSSLRYMLELMSDDQVAFNPFILPSSVCSIGEFVENTARVPGKTIVVHPCQQAGVTSYAGVPRPSFGSQAGAAMNETPAKINPLPSQAPLLMEGQANATMLALQAALNAEQGRRSAQKNRPDIDPSIQFTYRWRWPAIALLERNYELLSATPVIEQNAPSLLTLQRSELNTAFDAFCGTETSLENRQDYEILRQLWWADSQVLGIDAANDRAQRRAVDWDNGTRCEYREGKMISMGGTRPVNPLTQEKICAAWRTISEKFTAGELQEPPRFDSFTVDYSKRAGACSEQPHLGSSL